MWLAMALSMVGCVNGRPWNPMGNAGPPVLSPTASVGEVVGHLNANIERCTGWKADHVKITSNGFRLPATNATVAVQSPRNFRVLVSAVTIPVADMGSNDERMWFWFKQATDQAGGEYSYTCAHGDLERAQAKMGIPFRPNWLMEVMGVMPIDPATVTMTTDPADAGVFLLDSQMQSPEGNMLIRRMRVSRQNGTIIAHTLVDGRTGQALAEARMSDHQPDPETGVVLPHRISLGYPGLDQELSMTIASFEVNPRSVPPTTWQPTVAGGYPCKDIVTEQIVSLDSPPAVVPVSREVNPFE